MEEEGKEQGREGRKGRRKGVERARVVPSTAKCQGTEGRTNVSGLGYVWPSICHHQEPLG